MCLVSFENDSIVKTNEQITMYQICYKSGLRVTGYVRENGHASFLLAPFSVKVLCIEKETSPHFYCRVMQEKKSYITGITMESCDNYSLPP